MNELLDDKFFATAIPSVLSVKSNVDRIPSYPLVTELKDGSDCKKDDMKCPLGINYIVTSKAMSSGDLHGKRYEQVDGKTVRLETPIGAAGRLSVMLKWDAVNPTLFVNKTYHRMARVTIGNVYAAGWMARDLTNVVLLSNGYLLLHAAAVKLGDRVAILFGLSNTGKTRSVFTMVKDHGAQYYGDDLLMTDGINVFPCPYTAANVEPDEGPGIRYAIGQRMRRNIPFFSYIAGARRYSISDALGLSNLAEPAAVTDIVIMKNSMDPSIDVMDSHRAAKSMLAANRNEFTYASNSLFSASEYFESGISVNEALVTEQRMLDQLSRNVKCHYASGTPDRLKSSVRKILSE